MGGITLSSAVRTNLNSLQATSELMSSVQEKLSTGKKVNSALDNPNSFFTAKGLENRASDLSTLLDDMGQSVQTLKAADKGIEAISDLVDSAKAKANQAQQTSSQSERAQYASEYNELMTQIEDIAKDSGYGGKNLLGGTGNDLSVTFNEDGSSSLGISSVDYTDTSSSTGLNLSDLTEATSGTATLTVTGTAGTTLDSTANFATGDVITLTDANGTEVASLEIEADTTIEDLEALYDDVDGASAAFASNTLTVTSDFKLTTASSDATPANFTTDGTDSGFATDSDIDAALSKLKGAQDTLRSQASTFGTNLSI
ncbi:MAG: flagellin, partial [Roseibium sp.]